jgi:hypothetical protein
VELEKITPKELLDYIVLREVSKALPLPLPIYLITRLIKYRLGRGPVEELVEK